MYSMFQKAQMSSKLKQVLLKNKTIGFCKFFAYLAKFKPKRTHKSYGSYNMATHQLKILVSKYPRTNEIWSFYNIFYITQTCQRISLTPMSQVLFQE